MVGNLEYKVSFGKVARTLIYEHKSGSLLFTFDVAPSTNPSQGQWTLFLDREALTLQGERLGTNVPVAWVAEALERTKLYAASCGYQVEVVG